MFDKQIALNAVL